MRQAVTGVRRRTGLLRGLILAICAQLAILPALAGTARADELMLMDEQRPDTSGYGWLFAGLTLVAFGVAANGYQETQDNIHKAKNAYSSYLIATNAGDALYYRDLTNTYSHRAQAYESTANAALALGLIFAVTTVAIFRSDRDTTPILLSDRGVQWTYRF